MNILSVLASPRNQGNTAILLKEYLKGVEGLTSQVEIETIYLQAKIYNIVQAAMPAKKQSKSMCIKR